jgi:hypothetical protein
MVQSSSRYVAKLMGPDGLIREDGFDRLTDAMTALTAGLSLAGAERGEIHFKGTVVWTKAIRPSEARDAFRQRDVEAMLRRLANIDSDPPAVPPLEDERS